MKKKTLSFAVTLVAVMLVFGLYSPKLSAFNLYMVEENRCSCEGLGSVYVGTECKMQTLPEQCGEVWQMVSSCQEDDEMNFCNCDDENPCQTL